MKREIVSIDFGLDGSQELDELQKLYGSKTRSETVRRAVHDALNQPAGSQDQTLGKALEIINKLSDALIKITRN